MTDVSGIKVFREEEAEPFFFFFFPLRLTVIAVQLNYIDWRDESIASQLIFKLSHSLPLSSALSQMGHFHKVFIPSSSVPLCPVELLPL